MRLAGAYCYFCDDNGLPRIDATLLQRIYTLRVMESEARKEAERLERELLNEFGMPVQ